MSLCQLACYATELYTTLKPHCTRRNKYENKGKGTESLSVQSHAQRYPSGLQQRGKTPVKHTTTQTQNAAALQRKRRQTSPFALRHPNKARVGERVGTPLLLVVRTTHLLAISGVPCNRSISSAARSFSCFFWLSNSLTFCEAHSSTLARL